MTPIRVDDPAVEPVSLAAMRAYLRLDPDHDAEDGLVTSLLAAARSAIEAATGRILAPGRYRLMLTAWPADGRVPLPLSPLVALVRASVVDAQGAVTELGPGLVRPGPDPVEAPVLIVDPAAPSLMGRAALVEVAAGYGGEGPPLPPALAQAIRMLTAAWFEHRGDEAVPILPASVAALIAPHRRLRL
ncbi:head-tail connector protein [Methylobacterium iners]|uniref:PhiE125 gp8 family phage protein n=1 Tax=Methylobacterium iners TaxID=418707 RepID=A0ABQ4S1P4_9HYPH|nr:phage head-tail connector protein [Methylobacterium iners]GJD95712.1 hypothetical protein OCOJLMKI_2926 [Methylobacterium iners]